MAGRGDCRGQPRHQHHGQGRPQQGQGHQRGMGFQRLNDLAQKEGKEILNIISNRQSGFADLLTSKNLYVKPDWINLILQIAAKACEYTEEPLNGYSGLSASSGRVDNSRIPSALLMSFLNYIKTSNFLMLSLLPFISSFLTETNVGRRRHFPGTVKHILILCKTILMVMPTNVQQAMPVLCTIEMVVRNMRTTNTLLDDGEMDQKLQEVMKLCNDVMAEQSRHMSEDPVHRDQGRIQDKREDRPPPNNFRELSIFPTADDLVRLHQFLPFNKVHGQYPNTEHYLDTHFRLLREDFMRPLRSGITQYLGTTRKPGERQRLQNIRMYQDVHIVQPICTSDGICYRVSFDVRRLHGVRWEHTKRLIYGALVCLSPDSFTTVYLATVSHREPEQLRKGLVELRFQEGTDEVNQIGTFSKLVMAESSAYFEAYRHVLTGLKTINEETLPFTRYLVKCEKFIERPRYLEEDTKYDLRKLVDNDKTEIKEAFMDDSESEDDMERVQHNETTSILREIPLLDEKAWPPAEGLNLDKSQLDALRLALTRELAIIQGPPGTGKTYIGLRIVKALLQNPQHWNQREIGRTNGPILLICYTNHALDQFLEGISHFLHRGIVRVGGRSKSEVLERFLLRELRKGVRERKDIPLDVHRNRMDAMNEMDRVRSDIQKNVADLEASKRGLVTENSLEEHMKHSHFYQLKDGHISIGNKKVLSCWLGLEDGKALALHDQLLANDLENDEEDPVATDGRGTDNETENEEELEADNVEAQRRIVGLEDREAKKDEDFRQKRIMDMALEKLAVRFSELKIVPGHPKKKKQSDEVTEEEMKIRNLLGRTDTMSRVEENKVQELTDQSMEDRWRLYRTWLLKYRQHIEKDSREFEREYELAARRLQEVKQQEDLEIMQKATILGMTTTGAARYRDVLRQIQPRIIVIEEAAEVLEAHVVSALTPECQHLILIGDHKQLRPNPTDYKVAQVHKLKVSLFERLVSNGLPYVTLELQHRMAPNISQVLHHVYDNLKDHASVLNNGIVNGVSTNMFFIDHEKFEAENDDLQSKVNKHETDYVVALCRYLILQGYNPAKITILTPYTGQLMKIRNKLRDRRLQNVRACAIDNFQGEENDIIIVSLVRNNKEGKIGFLAENNRICVTLSRAKKAMYLIGNAALLGQMNDLWSKVIQTMKESKAVGRALPLYCKNHPDSRIEASCAKDFEKAPEGGCMLPCQARLQCGHVCPRICHTYDPEHVEHKCRKKCAKTCPRKHQCPKLCFENCGKCLVKERQRMPNCGHVQDIPCSEHITSYVCQAPCDHRLQCGHMCRNQCGQPHTKVCKQEVNRKLVCGHVMLMECCDDPETFPCDRKCSNFLLCDHQCRGDCGSCMEGRLHKPCQAPCNRTLVCGHQCDAPCTRNCPPCSAKCQNRCPHSICQLNCGKPCVECIEPCAWRCEHYECTKRCSQPCNRPRCNEPCKQMLQCGHNCIGLCGEPCPNKCRICHKDEVQQIFFGDEDEDNALFVQLEDCGHILEVGGMDTWMDTAEDIEDGKVDVKLKACPLCTVTIRQNLRYGKIIKGVLATIETVKAKVFGRQKEGLVLRAELHRPLDELNYLDRDGHETLVNRLKERDTEIITTEEEACIVNSIKFLLSLVKLSKEIKEHLNNSKYQELSKLTRDMKFFHAWILKERVRLGEQETNEAQLELTRMHLMATSIEAMDRVKRKGIELPLVVSSKFKRAVALLDRKTPLDTKDEEQVKEALKEVERIVPRSGLGISDEERLQIVKAIGLAQGHWYKCPNGHVYAIGECGGAMVEAKCPECDAIIGGRSHTLRQGNAVASEMDGARHAAWSEGANMQNFDWQQFAD